MARYYEETALTEFVKKYTPHINGETTMECVERAIRNAPTADVVPKSEYDRLEKLYNDMTQEAKGYLKRLYGIRADVAREIFEEIEKIISKEIHRWEVFREEETDLSERKYWEGGANSVRKLPCCMAELKKKYTEGER